MQKPIRNNTTSKPVILSGGKTIKTDYNWKHGNWFTSLNDSLIAQSLKCRLPDR